MEFLGATSGKMWLTFGWLLLGFYAVLFLQIILHEFGHMIAGWLSGYRFTSFRVGSLMWVKQGGQMRFRAEAEWELLALLDAKAKKQDCMEAIV